MQRGRASRSTARPVRRRGPYGHEPKSYVGPTRSDHAFLLTLRGVLPPSCGGTMSSSANRSAATSRSGRKRRDQPGRKRNATDSDFRSDHRQRATREVTWWPAPEHACRSVASIPIRVIRECRLRTKYQALAARCLRMGCSSRSWCGPSGQRYVVIAGHRRLAAWCRCASEAPSDPRWRTIDAVDPPGRRGGGAHADAGREPPAQVTQPPARSDHAPTAAAERSWTNRQVAEAVQKSEMYVSRRLRILEDVILREAVLDGGWR